MPEIKPFPSEKYQLAQEVLTKYPTKSGISCTVNTHGRIAFWHPLRTERINGHVYGGIGITDRTIEEVEEILPTVTRELKSSRGKIAFLGNGFSSAPQTVVRRYQTGSLHVPPIIVDCLDYPTVEEDVNGLFAQCQRHNLDLVSVTGKPLAKVVAQLAGINRAISLGDLITVNYFVGSGNPPEVLTGLSVAVNCCGPVRTSLEEQCSLLAKGGSLFIVRFNRVPQTPGFITWGLEGDINGKREVLANQIQKMD